MSHRVKELAIIRFLDGRLEEAARKELEDHLDRCHSCRAFHDAGVVSRAALRELRMEHPPPLDWARIDAGLAEKLEMQKGRSRILVPALLGAAATAAAAFLVTMVVSQRAVEAPAEDRQPQVADRTPAKTSVEEEPLPPLRAFVTFVAGEARSSEGAGGWHPLHLQTELSPGTRIQTTEQGTAGIQLGTSGCRLEPGTEVAIADLDDGRSLVELHQGRVTCAGNGDDQIIVVSMIEVVASAASTAHYSVDRSTPEVVVVELAEGTLRVRRPGGEAEHSGPVRLELTRDGESSGDNTAQLEAERTEVLGSPALGLVTRPSIASLHLPNIDGVERATVDGIEYGPLPLTLMRRPGMAHVELFPMGGGEPYSTEVRISLGPTHIEPIAVAAAFRQRPEERSIAPRIGTMDEPQVRRLRSIVSSKVRTCYERMLKRDPSIWGRIAVRLTVSPTGEARGVTVRSLAGGHPTVNSCVESALGAERYPPPRGGFVPVEQTITLSPRF